MRWIIAIGGLILTCIGVFGVLSHLLLSKDLAQMQHELRRVELRVDQELRLSSQVNGNIEKGFLGDSTAWVDVSVKFPFVPPMVDPAVVEATTKTIVRAEVQNLRSVVVLIPAPEVVMPGRPPRPH